jgi:hypothetical protein
LKSKTSFALNKILSKQLLLKQGFEKLGLGLEWYMGTTWERHSHVPRYLHTPGSSHVDASHMGPQVS